MIIQRNGIGIKGHYILVSTMHKKSIDKITNVDNYNQLLFSYSVTTAQALQQLIPSINSRTNSQQILQQKQKQLESTIKNAITTMGKFVDVQKAPLATALDHSLDIFEAVGDNIQMAVQRYRQSSKNGTLAKNKSEKEQSKRPQDQFQFIKPARFEFHHHQKDLTSIRTDLSFTKARPLQDKLHYVKSEEDLDVMIKDLKTQSQIAVDVEHSNKSYEGFTCLLQFSTRNNDYIVDVFPIWQTVSALKQVMEDPTIVKVMHGAEMDTKWLQRDFDIHIHNLFDTYRAARTLGLQKLSYAFLLSHYCQVTTDKTFQTADWRQRPLSEDMIHYARLDTHFLLQIFDRLRADLHQKALSMGLSPQEVFIDIYSTSHEVTKNQVQLFDINKKECLLQLRKEFNDTDFEIFSQIFRLLDDIARDKDIPFDQILNHKLQKQLIAKLKELLLVKADKIIIKIDKLIADLRIVDHLKSHLSKVKELLSSFFAKRQIPVRKEKKNVKPKITHLDEDKVLSSEVKKKTQVRVDFRQYPAKTYDYLSQSVNLITFEPIASFLANRFGISTKEEEKMEAEAQEEVQEVEEEASEEDLGEQSNQQGVIQFKRINPNVIYTIQDAEQVQEKYKPRKKRKEEDYEKKMLQKQKNIFELLED